MNVLLQLFEIIGGLSLESDESLTVPSDLNSNGKTTQRKHSAKLQGILLHSKVKTVQLSKSFKNSKLKKPQASPMEGGNTNESIYFYNEGIRSNSVTSQRRKPFNKTKDEELIELIFSKVNKKPRANRSCNPKFYSRNTLVKDSRLNTSCIFEYSLSNIYFKTRKRVRCYSTMARFSGRVGFGGSAIHKTKVTIDDFEIIKGLSSGAYGKVCLVKKRSSGDYFAMKIIDKEITAEKSQEDYIRSEVTIMRSIDSDFIVKLYYSFQNIRYLFFVMEYMNGGDLGNILQLFGCLEERVI